MKDCIFCQIVAGKIPSKKVWESEDVIVFNDISPRAPKHVLIVPKKHIESVAKAQEIDEKIMGKLMMTAKSVAEKIGIDDAFRLETYSGKKAGQTVMHLHVHLLGGWKEKQKH